MNIRQVIIYGLICEAFFAVMLSFFIAFTAPTILFKYILYCICYFSIMIGFNYLKGFKV